MNEVMMRRAFVGCTTLSFSLYLSSTFLQPMSVFGITMTERVALSLCKTLCVVFLAIWSYRHRQNPRAILSISLTGIIGAVALRPLPFGATDVIASGLCGISSGALLMLIAMLTCACCKGGSETTVLFAFLIAPFVAPMLGSLAKDDSACVQTISYAGALFATMLAVVTPQGRATGSLTARASISKYRSSNKLITFFQSIMRFEVLLTALGSWILSFSFGVFESAVQDYDVDLPSSNRYLMAAVVCITLVYFLRSSLRGRQASMTVFLTYISTIFLVAYIGVMVVSSVNTVLYSLMLIGLDVYYLALWLFMIKEANGQELPPAFVFGLLVTGPIATLRMIGKAIPTGFRAITGQTLTPEQLTFIVLFVFTCMLLFLIVIYTKSESSLNARFRLADNMTEGSRAHRQLEVTCKAYGLSKQECNVLIPYSQGRSATYIADTLGLSPYTVKEYVRRSYKKLDVHSRQELIDFLELSAGSAGRQQTA